MGGGEKKRVIFFNKGEHYVPDQKKKTPWLYKFRFNQHKSTNYFSQHQLKQTLVLSSVKMFWGGNSTN